jgi:hypothetical protein
MLKNRLHHLKRFKPVKQYQLPYLIRVLIHTTSILITAISTVRLLVAEQVLGNALAYITRVAFHVTHQIQYCV